MKRRCTKCSCEYEPSYEQAACACGCGQLVSSTRKRTDSRYASEACRLRAWRRRRAEQAAAEPSVAESA